MVALKCFSVRIGIWGICWICTMGIEGRCESRHGNLGLVGSLAHAVLGGSFTSGRWEKDPEWVWMLVVFCHGVFLVFYRFLVWRQSVLVGVSQRGDGKRAQHGYGCWLLFCHGVSGVFAASWFWGQFWGRLPKGGWKENPCIRMLDVIWSWCLTFGVFCRILVWRHIWGV